MRVLCVGDGRIWSSRGGRPVGQNVSNYLFHRETWTYNIKDEIVNTVGKSKNKRDFPTYPPLRYPPK